MKAPGIFKLALSDSAIIKALNSRVGTIGTAETVDAANALATKTLTQIKRSPFSKRLGGFTVKATEGGIIKQLNKWARLKGE